MSNLISISGRIGSGKDLVAKIIRRLHMIELIEKGTVPAHTLPALELLLNGDPFIASHWKVRKFAGKLKEIASMLTGIPVHKFEDQDFKKTNLGEEWAYHTYTHDKRLYHEMTVREFLQRLGTDSIRNGLHDNTWVNALFNSIEPEEKTIITDTRFPNELKGVEKIGGITIRVHRDGTKKDNEHISETALDDYKFMYELGNNGTIQDLEYQVKQILVEQNIL